MNMNIKVNRPLIPFRSCKDTFYIPEFIKNNIYQKPSREIHTKLTEISKTLAEQASKSKQDKQRLLKRKAELLTDIRNFRKEINDQLDKLEKNSVDEIEDKVKCLESKIEEGLKQLQAHKDKITSANKKLAFFNQNQADVFVNMKMAEDAAHLANQCMEDTKMKSTVADMEFQPDRTILTQLEKSSTLGLLTENPTKIASSLFQIRRELSYCVKVKSDNKDCDITCACYLKDGQIFLADKNNMKLKQIHDYDYTVTDHCDLPGEPWQVCSINTAGVALTLPLQNEVHFISAGRKMKATYKIKTDFECYGLAYTSNNLYISDGNTSVYMYSLSGRKLKQFSKTQSGQKLFSDISSLAVRQDATRIYVADFYNGVIVLDNNFQVITTYNGRQLMGASCCYISEAGSVLVSGGNSKNVVQFTSDGELIGDVIKANKRRSGIKSVCCNQQMSKMFVCRSHENNIEVYDI
jgi:hypothetical protein